MLTVVCRVVGFAVLAYYVHSRTHNLELVSGILFFFTMELLQGIQYFWIDDCSNPWNRFFTLVGFIHICASSSAMHGQRHHAIASWWWFASVGLQPYFTHIINRSLTKSKRLRDQYEVILRLSLVAGAALFIRYACCACVRRLLSGVPAHTACAGAAAGSSTPTRPPC